MSYENYEITQGWDEAAFGSFTSEQAAYYSAELRRCGLASSQHLHVLDIGFGNGTFLGWCRNKGWQCDGVEINDRLITRASKHGYITKNNVSDFSFDSLQKPYDLITAFDVLEHIDRNSLVPFLSSLDKVCSPQTLLMLRFPNGDNPFSMPIQNGDVTHATAIGQMMLRQVAQLAGFEVIALGGPCQPLRGTSMSRRLLLAVGNPIRWAIGTIIKHLFMGGMPVTFSANLLAVLRRSNATTASTCLD
ncbi:hypothetical protein J2X19_000257 [Rhodoferax ferrireducens]|uniref:Methyltransferase type 12 n=1 Tax=Rhodoferax ferrireducens TaxID=192843 RepID=A0ABU2C2P6_9BURK|nr:class I SAM-dependent methyltransferase [Rhodoferax ferrireducens]MDR7375599.1 hypothetical protein [Rhodoferax ferrireducens]